MLNVLLPQDLSVHLEKSCALNPPIPTLQRKIRYCVPGISKVYIMIRNVKIYREFEKQMQRQLSITHEQSLNILDSLWLEGVALGVLPPKNSLEGVETDIRIAKILNLCSKKS